MEERSEFFHTNGITMDEKIMKKRLIGLTKLNIMSLGKKKDAIKEQLGDWRQMVNRHLDDIHMKLVNDVDILHKKLTSSLFTNISKLSKNKITIEEFNKEVEKCVQSAQSHICNFREDGDGDSFKNGSGGIPTGEKVYEMDYNLSIDLSPSIVADRLKSVGSIQTDISTKDIKEVNFVAQDSEQIADRFDVSVELIRNSSIREYTGGTLTRKSNGYSKQVQPPSREYDIGGAAIAEDDTVLLTDRMNKKLLFCHVDGTITSELDLPARPSTVVMLNRKEAAVCFPDCESKPEIIGGPSKWSSKVKILDTTEKKFVKDLGFPGKCWHISQRLDNKIVAACFSEIYVYDGYKGIFTKRLVFTNSCIRHLCTDDAGKVYFTDWNENSVTCVDIDRDISVYFYKHPDLKGPTSVSIDMDNRSYVVGLVSHNVHQIDSAGNLIKIILSKTDGLKEPQILSFKPFSAKFVLVEKSEHRKDKFKIYGVTEHFCSTCI